MGCLGLGSIKEISNYCHDTLTRGKQQQIIDIIYPEEFEKWYSTLIFSVFNNCYNRGKKDITIILIVGKPKDNETGKFIKTHAMIGGATKNVITLVISKKLFGSLKQSKLNRRASYSIYVLVEYLWHEIYHVKGHIGKGDMEYKDFKTIMDEYWERCKYLGDELKLLDKEEGVNK